MPPSVVYGDQRSGRGPGGRVMERLAEEIAAFPARDHLPVAMVIIRQVLATVLETYTLNIEASLRIADTMTTQSEN
jgi:hypothetical protein